MFRAGYALRKRSGVLRRSLPATSWDAQPLTGFLRDRRLADPAAYVQHRSEQRRPFFFETGDRETFRERFADWDATARHPVSATDVTPVAIADALCEGVFRFFEHREINLGCPPNWHQHPVTGNEYPTDRHWSEIGDFAAGDIKYVWEPSRFAWAYPLVRAYWRTGDERYPRLFWELADDWRRANRPQQGVNWKCGQEAALRVMACCFALYGFADSPETTAARVSRLAQVMAVSGQRIASNLSYAVSQQNNHGITEATGLWTLGLLFPEFTSADEWAHIGREALEQQCRRLIDDDGAFSQHSVNYQRVMLHACVWAVRLGELHGQPLSDELRDRVCRAGTFLWRLQDEQTGRLPRYGANDGAVVLPLTNCESQDYRPVVQAVGWLRNRKRRFEDGPWDEEMLWLWGEDALATDVEANIEADSDVDADAEQRGDWQGPQAGYCVLRSESGHLSTRAGSYRYRPSHADMLHADVWWRGQNVALDAGTHSYNAPSPWDSPLARTAFHNTVTVDDCDQMDRAGRFLWLPWLSGEQTPTTNSADGHLTYWEGTHDGYRRLTSPVNYRRGILRIGSEHWLIVDSLAGNAAHSYRLHWLLLDAPYVFDEDRQHIRLQTGAGPYDVCLASVAETNVSCVRADPDGPRGWYAPCYGDRQPALSLACVAEAQTVLFWTLLGPSCVDMRCRDHELHAVTEDWSCCVQHGALEETGEPLVRSVTVTGTTTDRLCVDISPPPLPRSSQK